MLLSAALIVRDAETTLGSCLQSIATLADQVVVHDTGSLDSTVERALAAGVEVSRGVWADDFAAARNEALARCLGDWVLSLDADEVVTANAADLRRWLATVDARVLLVTVNNPTADDSLGYSYTPVKLFRRAGARWRGRVHEQVVHDARDEVDHAKLSLVPPELLQLHHTGYADPGALRRKGERNGRLAAMELADLTADPASEPGNVARAALSIGRAALGTGELQRALDAFEAVRDLVDAGQVWIEATDHLARLLLGAGEAWIVPTLVDQLSAAGVSPDYCGWLRGQALAQTGAPREALAELDGLDRIVDPAGRVLDPGPVEELRGLCRLLLG